MKPLTWRNSENRLMYFYVALSLFLLQIQVVLMCISVLATISCLGHRILILALHTTGAVYLANTTQSSSRNSVLHEHLGI